MNIIEFGTKIITGDDSLGFLRELKEEKILVVTDKFMIESRILEHVTVMLDPSNIYQVFSDIVPDPTIENVTNGVQKALSFNPTIIIAFGGGSVIDAAKAIKLMVKEIDDDVQEKLIIIPTTSGTGSEVTNFSVITNKKKNLKYPIVDTRLQPDIAILDSKLVHSVPAKITADTGWDVLTHALEAYVSTNSTDFSDALAEKAIQLIFLFLERAYIDGDDLEARERVHNASCLAGLAFNQASLGLCHGIAHPMGGKLHMAHGRINGVLLPSIILYNSNQNKKALDKYGLLSKAIGISNTCGNVGLRNLVNHIKELRRKLKMPADFIEAGYTQKDIAPFIDEICRQSLLDPTTATNPSIPTENDVKNIIMKLF